MNAVGREFAPSFPTPVLDAIGVGLVLIDEDGEVTLQNAIADDLVARRVGNGSLLEVLREHASTIPTSVSLPIGSPDQRKVEAFDGAGKKCVIGYRIVRSARLGTIFSLRDISDVERVRSEQRQLERLSQVGQACAMVAHEIGNPLAAIKATIQSIEHEAAAAGLQDPISAVYSEIDRLDKVLSQLLGFVRHRPPRKVKVDVPTVVAKARQAAACRLDGVEFTATYRELQPVWLDPDQITQVLINLFLNAADAQPEGGSLSVSAEVVDDRLAIRVRDRGPGIAPDLHQQIFESFYTTKQTGTGLGLAICYRIISDHGGTIGVEEGSDEGTCMLITLPTRREP